MAASVGGLDALVFTGGVGENAAEVRERAAKALRFLGVHVDASRNRAVAGDRDISLEDAAARTLIIHAREDLEIARQVRNAMAQR